MGSLRYAFQRGFKSFWEHRGLNLVTVGVIGISLTVCLLFLLVVFNLSGLLDEWGRDVQVSAYLRAEVDAATAFQLKEELQQRPEVVRVTYVSREEALESFSTNYRELGPIIEDLEQNPLPASLEIRLDEGLQEPARVALFVDTIRRPEFEQIDYSQEWVERFYAFVNLLRLSGLVLGGLLLTASAFVISQTVKLTVYARREELTVLQLVGGTGWFIRAPFLIEGLLQGLLGAMAAVAAVSALYRLVFVELQQALQLGVAERFLSFLPDSYLLGMVLLGTALGLGASHLACGRFLHLEVE